MHSYSVKIIGEILPTISVFLKILTSHAQYGYDLGTIAMLR
jgi:hypothetical protein